VRTLLTSRKTDTHHPCSAVHVHRSSTTKLASTTGAAQTLTEPCSYHRVWESFDRINGLQILERWIWACQRAQYRSVTTGTLLVPAGVLDQTSGGLHGCYCHRQILYEQPTTSTFRTPVPEISEVRHYSIGKYLANIMAITTRDLNASLSAQRPVPARKSASPANTTRV